MYTLQSLRSDESEYGNVAECFLRSASGQTSSFEIQNIQKVTNSELMNKFQWREQLYRALYGHVQVVQLFHGTKKANIPSILERNLEVARHGQNIGHRFGNGVSFSASSKYSSHYCDKYGDEKQMLLCKVLISNVIEVPEVRQGCHNSQPPFIEGRWPLQYDTTAKNKLKMDVIVKHQDHTYYPEYIITFRKILLLPKSMVVRDLYPQIRNQDEFAERDFLDIWEKLLQRFR